MLENPGPRMQQPGVLGRASAVRCGAVWQGKVSDANGCDVMRDDAHQVRDCTEG